MHAAFTPSLPLSVHNRAPLAKIHQPVIQSLPRRPQQSSRATASSQPEPTSETTQMPFPKLYDAWFPPHQLRNQMQESLNLAFMAGHTLLELQWPTVPNLEEIAAGTLLNFEFGKHVAEVLDMQAPAKYMLIKRYLAEFCNLYWVVQVAQCDAFVDRTVWAISTDGVAKSRASNLRNVKLGNMRNPPATSDDDIVVILDPRANSVWEKGVKMRPANGATVFLNSQFSESYGLTGPRRGLMKEIQAAYFLKRVTRGYAFYAYPGPWRGILEHPDTSVEEVGSWDDIPSLRELSGRVREESNKRYGGFYNDRYVRGFGGRL